MRDHLVHLIVALSLLLLPGSQALAQFIDDEDTKKGGIRLVHERTSRFQVGIIVTSTGSPMKGIVGYTPIPQDWPEQQVKIVDEQSTSQVRSVSYETVAGTVRRMVVKVPYVRAGDAAKAIVTMEITRHHIAAPENTDQFVIPKKPDRRVRKYLAASPYIETRHAKIRKLAKEIPQGVEGDWQKVEAMYDWVRDNIKYENGPLKGAAAALKDGTGDCEELSSLFIAMCRINSIPARTVWVPGHCYPEFYLADEQGTGHWFPCQVAGTRAFGSMPEHRPILQKGDNFRVPEKKDRQRYVAEHLKVGDVPGGRKPKVQFIRRALAD